MGDRRRLGLVLLALVLLGGCGGSSSSSGTSSGGRFSPYVDVTLQPPFDFAGAARQTSIKTYTLAFVVAARARCQPRWGGTVSLSSPYPAAQIAALRAQGGDVRVSLGGRSGTELALACPDTQALTRAYRSVIDRFRLTKLDVDLEGPSLSPGPAMSLRWQALSALQARQQGHRSLDISITLPVTPQGLTSDGLSALRSALSAGVSIGHVNLLAMDYGDGVAPAPAGRMAAYAQQAAIAAHAQLARLGSAPAARGWDMIAVTPMIGINDVSDEVFSLGDAHTLVGFARAQGLGALSMWSSTRDKECPGGVQHHARATCSGVHQSPYAFARSLGEIGS